MASNLVSKVEIIVSAKNLLDKDVLSKSDPMAVLFMKHGTNKWEEMGRTEVIDNNLNPEWSKSFILDYFFEEIQHMKFQIYDVDDKSSKLDHHDFLGEFEVNLGELVSRNNVEAKLTGRGINKGLIQLKCSEIGSCKEVLIFKFLGHNMDKKDLFGKSDPFLEMYQYQEPIQFTNESISNPNRYKFNLAHRTEHILKTLNPDWRAFQVRNWKLCQGDRDRLIKIEVYDWNKNGSNLVNNDSSSRDFIGSCFTSVNDLQQHQSQQAYFKLINNQKKAKKKSYKDSGQLTLSYMKIETEYTFVDYISGGTQLHFTVAVDFTASNGPQNNPRSLHYVNDRVANVNQYELAISSVGNIIQDYDHTKMFPGIGFGAKLPPNHNVVSHCFPMSFNHEQPYCHRVEGLLDTYRRAVRSLTLFGPTNFSPCIRHVQKFAEQHMDGSKYFVLLIITDGIITDIDATVSAIVDCSFLPMSIIIIGVGQEDFSAMDMLDCDGGLLKSRQKVAERDIVQFVPLRDFVKSQSDALSNQAALARAVLAELPDQVAVYMRRHAIKPKAPESVPALIGTDTNQRSYDGDTQNTTQGQAQPPYASQSQPSYSGQGQPPDMGQGQPPYAGLGQPPYMGQGQPPYVGQGQPPYAGQPPYMGPGQPPYVGQTQPPYMGQPPYAGQGQPPYVGQVHPPYTGLGQPQYAGQGQPPYVGQGHPPYVGQGQPPYVSQGQLPYPAPGASSPYYRASEPNIQVPYRPNVKPRYSHDQSSYGMPPPYSQ